MGGRPLGTPTSGRRRDDRDPNRALMSCLGRPERNDRGHARFVSALELAAAVEDDRPAHPGREVSSGGVTVFMAGGGAPPPTFPPGAGPGRSGPPPAAAAKGASGSTRSTRRWKREPIGAA